MLISKPDLVDSVDLALNAVVLSASASRPLVSRHVHTHNMLVYREVLEVKTNTLNTHR